MTIELCCDARLAVIVPSAGDSCGESDPGKKLQRDDIAALRTAQELRGSLAEGRFAEGERFAQFSAAARCVEFIVRRHGRKFPLLRLFRRVCRRSGGSCLTGCLLRCPRARIRPVFRTHSPEGKCGDQNSGQQQNQSQGARHA